MKGSGKQKLSRLLFSFVLVSFLWIGACGPGTGLSPEKVQPVSDHFDGERYFNPGSSAQIGEGPKRGILGWVWRWIAGADWPEWPEYVDFPLGVPPVERVSNGNLQITSVGHSTFLIQMDGFNLLTDPIWSDRCSPVSWTGPRRRTRPGIRLEDLPPIDAVLVSHNHYDHLDLPTLEQLAQKGVKLALVPLGNRELVRQSGLPAVDELDWWQSVRLSPDVTVTLVPAQHFSSRTLWDRNRVLWGGFVVSGPSGNVYFAGDTGYGPHFQEIARRFAPLRAALLPISPFQPKSADRSSDTRLRVHMRPEEAVQACLDLGAPVSIAAHYRVFQLGPDGFDDAVQGLASTLEKRELPTGVFLALNPGQGREWVAPLKPSLVNNQLSNTPVRLTN
ncbi:MAG: MBL fold metallo-hydrolase [Deltaproteobacteria bacterium]|nr:MBL fold metallo-hydrolase [Deltaproteobacteria bacterium]